MPLPSFEEIYRLTDTISGAAAFSREECQAYYDILAALPHGGHVLEIGLHLGRSSSIVMQLQRALTLEYCGIDPFEADTGPAWMRLLLQTGAQATVHVKPSQQVWLFGLLFDVILVDGDHTAKGVRADIDQAVNHLAPRGHILFHDYTQADPHVRDVYPTVQQEMAGHPNMREEAVVHRLGIWKDLPEVQVRERKY